MIRVRERKYRKERNENPLKKIKGFGGKKISLEDLKDKVFEEEIKSLKKGKSLKEREAFKEGKALKKKRQRNS